MLLHAFPLYSPVLPHGIHHTDSSLCPCICDWMYFSILRRFPKAPTPPLTAKLSNHSFYRGRVQSWPTPLGVQWAVHQWTLPKGLQWAVHQWPLPKGLQWAVHQWPLPKGFCINSSHTAPHAIPILAESVKTPQSIFAFFIFLFFDFGVLTDSAGIGKLPK